MKDNLLISNCIKLMSWGNYFNGDGVYKYTIINWMEESTLLGV